MNHRPPTQPIIALVFFALWTAPTLAEPPTARDGCSTGPTVEAIAAQRDRFNVAIRNEDIDVIDEVLADDVVLVTGTDSDVYSGRVRQLALWARNFQADDRLIYARTPTCIDVSARFPIALEHGRWRGDPASAVDQADNPGTFAAGRYSAKWRNVGGAWTIEVETYMTDACGGAMCPTDEGSR